MQQYIDGLRIANSVMMLKMQHAGSVVIVEGDSDARFYHKHFVNTCRVIPANSKNNVIQAMMVLGNRNAAGILGIIDCDYMFLENQLPNHPNIVYTDYHDLEVLLLVSPSLENLLRELAPGEKLHMIDDLAKRIRESLFALGTEIGYLRWISYRENLRLNFKSLPYSHIVDVKRKNVDMKGLIRIVNNGTSVNISDVENRISALRHQDADYKHICQGHDLVFLLEFVVPVVLEDIFGSSFSNSIRPKCKSYIFDDSLRLGYEKSFFVSSKLYLDIKSWETRNAPFIVV